MSVAAAPPTGGSTAAAPVGWRPDPWGRHQLRYYDGKQWTEHVADGGLCSVDSSPVADLPRSRPPAAVTSPTEGLGPRVVADADTARAGGIDAPLLLLDESPDAAGVRRLVFPDDTLAGEVRAVRRGRLHRLVDRLAAAPPPPPSRFQVLDASDAVALTVGRGPRRTRPEVDVSTPEGPVGRVVAESVRQSFSARVLDAQGAEMGRLEAVAPGGRMQVVDAQDRPIARLTPVWDIPGERWSLPPGVVLLDRRPPDGGALEPARARLLLGALVSPTLLVR